MARQIGDAMSDNTKLDWFPEGPVLGNMDPYSYWFLRTGDAVFDFSKFRTDSETSAESKRFLALQTQNKPFTDTDLQKKITWKTFPTKHTTRYHAIALDHLENVETEFLPAYIFSDKRFMPFQDRIVASLEVSEDSGDADSNAENGGEESQTTRLLHIAPIDDVMMPPLGSVDMNMRLPYTPPTHTKPEQAIIYGVIDDGINLLHEKFQEPSGSSRIDFAWVQDSTAPKFGKSNVMFGREFKGREIESAIKNAANEEEALRHLGLVRHGTQYSSSLTKRFSHGTFVLDQAAGYLPNRELYESKNDDGTVSRKKNVTHPADRRLITVQLARRVSSETSGALYSLFVAAGLRYIFDRAKTVAQNLRNGQGRKIPLVINFSYGLSGGPHNGQHVIERLIDDLITEVDTDSDVGPLIVPMPAGNRFLQNGHASRQASVAQEVSLNMDWVTQPDDGSPNYLEIWVPQSAPGDNVELVIKGPRNSQINKTTFKLPILKNSPMSVGRSFNLSTDEGAPPFARVSVDRLDADMPMGTDCCMQCAENTGVDKTRILIALAPTKQFDESANCLPPGIWSVSATCKLEEGQWIEAWIPRDDTPPGFKSQARTSYLQKRNDDRTDQSTADRKQELGENVPPLEDNAGMSRYGTVSGIATSKSLIVVGGGRILEDNIPSVYSGASHGGIRAPDVMAPADRSRVFSGIVGASGRSGGSFPVNGTSAATPIVARCIGDHLEHNTYANSSEARTAVLEAISDESSRINLESPAANHLKSSSLRAWRGRNRVIKPHLLPQKDMPLT